MEALMNDEADHLASSKQKPFQDLPKVPALTFHMNAFTYYHVTGR